MPNIVNFDYFSRKHKVKFTFSLKKTKSTCLWWVFGNRWARVFTRSRRLVRLSQDAAIVYCSVSLHHKNLSSNGNVPRSWMVKTRRRKNLNLVWLRYTHCQVHLFTFWRSKVWEFLFLIALFVEGFLKMYLKFDIIDNV